MRDYDKFNEGNKRKGVVGHFVVVGNLVKIKLEYILHSRVLFSLS